MKYRLFANHRSCGALLISSICFTMSVRAQETANPSSTAGEAVALEEMVVTAAGAQKKRTESGALGDRTVQDTPFSVSVLNRESLEARQSNSLGDAFFGDPSVVTTVNSYASGWGSPIQVRGLEVAWDSFRLNGVPSDAWGFEWPLEIMEQVELLKGSTGFMYGFGSPGGMVNYKTKKPLDTPYASVTAGMRSTSIWSIGGDVSQRVGPNDAVGYRINTHYESGETYNGGEIETLATTLSVAGKVRDDLTLTADVVYLNRNLENEGALFAFYQYSGSSLPKPIDGSKEIKVDGTYWNIEYTVASTGLIYELNPDWKATVDFTFSHKHNDTKKSWAYIQNEAGDYDLNIYQLGGDTDRQYFQAIVEGSFETGKLSHQIVTGTSALYTRGYDGLYYDWDSIGYGNIYGGMVQTSPIPPHSRATTFSSEALLADVFISDTVEVLPGLSLLAGGRYNNYDQEGGYSTDEITPTYALIYKPINELTVYTSYVESLEEGGTVGTQNGGRPYTNAGELLEPLISKQYEVGAKYESEKWGASVAVFRLERGANIDRENSDNTVTLLQDGVTLYQGIEASGAVKLWDDLTVSAGAMWLDPTYDKLSDSAAAIEGNRAAGASRYQAVLQASYNVAYMQGLEIHTGVRYYGDAYNDQQNTLKFPDYTLANLGASYRTKLGGKATIFRADISNLFDKKYWSVAGAGAPISAALSVKTEF